MSLHVNMIIFDFVYCINIDDVRLMYFFNVSNNIAHNVSLIKHEATSKAEITVIGKIPDRIPLNSSVSYKMQVPLSFTGKTQTMLMGHETLKFSFHDLIRNKYTLIFAYSMTNSKVNIRVITESEN